MREYNIEFHQRVEINFDAEEEIRENFLEELYKAYPDYEWDDTDTGIDTIETKMGTYIPAVMYTRNGDGSPAEYDVEFELCERDIEDFVKKFIEDNELIDTQFYLDSVYCRLE